MSLLTPATTAFPTVCAVDNFMRYLRDWLESEDIVLLCRSMRGCTLRRASVSFCEVSSATSAPDPAPDIAVQGCVFKLDAIWLHHQSISDANKRDMASCSPVP